MLIELYAVEAVFSGLSWNWTAIGTVALALATFAALGYTILATRHDRAQAKADREDADKRLKEDRAVADKHLNEERNAGNRRVEAEREHAEKVRRRDRQIANAAALAGRVADAQALLPQIPGAETRVGQGSQSIKDALAAIASLRHGALTEAAMLGTDQAAEAAADRYRVLLRLLVEAANARLERSYPDRDRDTLRHYARWVLISLSNLAENETVPRLAAGGVPPQLGLAEHTPAWLPDPLPQGWDEMGQADLPVRITSQATIGGGGNKINTQGHATGPLPA